MKTCEKENRSRMLESLSLPLPDFLSRINFIASILFILEAYNTFGHMCILLRVRLLPRKDLIRIRYYFVIETVVVCVTAFLFTGQLQVFAALHFIQHMFSSIGWTKISFWNKVISWSSLDWQKSPNKHVWEWGVILLVMFDTMTHAANCYILLLYMSAMEILVSLAVCQTAIMKVLFNPRFAWCNPQNVPEWISKRIQPVKEGCHF